MLIFLISQSDKLRVGSESDTDPWPKARYKQSVCLDVMKPASFCTTHTALMNAQGQMSQETHNSLSICHPSRGHYFAPPRRRQLWRVIFAAALVVSAAFSSPFTHCGVSAGPLHIVACGVTWVKGSVQSGAHNTNGDAELP